MVPKFFRYRNPVLSRESVASSITGSHTPTKVNSLHKNRRPLTDFRRSMEPVRCVSNDSERTVLTVDDRSPVDEPFTPGVIVRSRRPRSGLFWSRNMTLTPVKGEVRTITTTRPAFLWLTLPLRCLLFLVSGPKVPTLSFVLSYLLYSGRPVPQSLQTQRKFHRTVSTEGAEKLRE